MPFWSKASPEIRETPAGWPMTNGSSDLVYQGDRSVVGGITITMSTKPAVKSTRIRGAGSQRPPQIRTRRVFIRLVSDLKIVIDDSSVGIFGPVHDSARGSGSGRRLGVNLTFLLIKRQKLLRATEGECSGFCSDKEPPKTKNVNNVQQGGGKRLKRKYLITVDSLTEQESALGAGGRKFESCRPDQWFHHLAALH